MVASNEEDFGWIEHFEAKQKTNHIYGIGASIHKIAQKYVVHGKNIPSPFVGPRKCIEKLQQIWQLPMNVAVHTARQRHFHQRIFI